MAPYKLTYFNGRGRAEVIRMIFALSDVEYEDVRVTKEEWATMKPNAPFGQLPILEFEGKKFCQSCAVGRYLARKYKLAGKTPEEELRADMLIDCMEDAIKPMITFWQEQDETRKAEGKKKFSEELLPASYANFEKILKENKGGDGFLVGDGLTWADLAFLMFVGYGKMSGNEELLSKYPKMNALKERVEKVPKVAAWIAKRPVTEF